MQSIPASFDSPVAAHDHDEFVCTRGSRHLRKKTQTANISWRHCYYCIIGAAAATTKRSLARMAGEWAMLSLPVNQKSCAHYLLILDSQVHKGDSTGILARIDCCI